MAGIGIAIFVAAHVLTTVWEILFKLFEFWVIDISIVI